MSKLSSLVALGIVLCACLGADTAGANCGWMRQEVQADQELVPTNVQPHLGVQSPGRRWWYADLSSPGYTPYDGYVTYRRAIPHPVGFYYYAPPPQPRMCTGFYFGFSR